MELYSLPLVELSDDDDDEPIVALASKRSVPCLFLLDAIFLNHIQE